MLKQPIKLLSGAFPIVQWLPKYTIQKAVCDLIAGITVGLTLIPQSIAYAALAGLGPEYGLYSSLCGGFIYTIFGTVKDLNVAPTALISLLTFTYTHDSSFGQPQSAILLCFLSGIIETGFGLLHLGFLVDFVSTPVVAGFTSAGALTIAAAQIKNMLGLNFKAETFVKIMYNVFYHIKETSLWDAALSIICCCSLIMLREMKRFGNPNTDNIWKTSVWFLSVSRNALLVIICAFTAFLLKKHDLTPFSLIKNVPQGLPPIQLPFIISNGTETFNFIDVTSDLGTGIIVVPLVSILSNIAIAKAFADGKVLDASQEMLAVGLCNIFGSFFGSFPINASFSRAAVNNASGARTTFGGIFTGILVMFALTFLTPYFSYIPKATLSSVIICAVIYMVELKLSRLIWRINRIDFFPLLVTLVACLVLSIEIGIVIGIVVDLLLVLYYTSRPKIETEIIKHEKNFQYMKVVLVGTLFYSAAEFTRDKVLKMITSDSKFLVFDCANLRKIDFTAAKCIDALIKDLNEWKPLVVFLRPKTEIDFILRKAITDANCYFIKNDNELDTLFDEKANSGYELTSVCANEAYENDDEKL
ncbi:PREDICTED: sodium-independent sulfate anion transporter-like isoform X2 [Nicrophorus vespilloides]|uniref:Sodium-independent sulfate anion transporter-like isoform X2 n=1 Tax=Nicrophorus vespilloides TaxID=110193 RepID=A0ABM1NDR1_NICVS|nr:PREDICTED: sodium-independent sulfate anion transporter-like isoform X2 [Nicrophorus vespilloides]